MRRLGAAAALAALTIGCGSHSSPTAPPTPVVTTPAPVQPAITFLSIVSTVGDPIGRGDTKRMTLSDTDFSISLTPDHRDLLVVTREHGLLEPWRLHLSAAAGAALSPGTYTSAASDTDSTRPIVNLSGNGLGGDVTAQFTIKEATFDGPRAIRRFDATFEQRSAGFAQGLTGEIQIVDFASDLGTGGAANIDGKWSGRVETGSAAGPLQFEFQQSGSRLTGNWTAPSFSWTGTFVGTLAFGGLSGVVTFEGRYPLGAVCSSMANVIGFYHVPGQTIAFYPWYRATSGSCPSLPVGNFVLQSRP